MRTSRSTKLLAVLATRVGSVKVRRVAIGLAAGVALTSVGVALASAPSGNAPAIAFGRSVVKAYRNVPGVSYTQHGYFTMNSGLGRKSFFQYQGGKGSVPAGWVPATEHAVVALRGGHYLWVEDHLRPLVPPCHQTLCNGWEPVEVVVTKAGRYWRFDLPGARFACFGKLNGALPWKIGAAWQSVFGQYGPLVHQGNAVLVTSTYPWTSDQTATETDTFSARTKLQSAWRVMVPMGTGATEPAFTYTGTNKNLTKAPTAPRITLCK